MTRSPRQSQDGFRSRPGLLFRPAAERFHSRHGWLDSWHSFSFAGHYDPRWRGFGPLLVINDDTIAAKSGFGMHPHRDMEIITVMVEGVLTHRDSMGNARELHADEVQRMSAGTGVVHSEINEAQQACRLLQIWIAPDSRGHSPSYGQKRFVVGNDWTPLIDPDQVDGAMAIRRPVRIWRVRMEAGQRLALPVAGDAHGWIQMIDGEVGVEVLDDRDRSGAGEERGQSAANAPIEWDRRARSPGGDGQAPLETRTDAISGEASRPAGIPLAVRGRGDGAPGCGGELEAAAAVGATGGARLRRGDGLGFIPSRIMSLWGGEHGADVLLLALE